MTAPDELETTLLEWAKGPYQLSAAECRVVMARLAELEGALAQRREFSEPTVHQSDDGTVTIEWGVRGWSNCTKVADDLIDVWVSDKNHMVALKSDLTLANNQLRNAMGAVIDSGGYCEGPHDVADAIYRLTAERDAQREELLAHRAVVDALCNGSAIEPLRAAADPLHTHNTPETQ